MKRLIRKLGNPRSDEYLDYIDSHRKRVKKAWDKFLKPFLQDEGYEDYIINEVEADILQHDMSKYQEDEFQGYCNHWYPSPGYDDDSDYDKAWMLHKHRNPHHWQYWVTLHDDGSTYPIDMDFKSICNMLCDWSSFQFTADGGTAVDWYNKEGDSMILSDNTRDIVEDILDRCEGL